MVVRRVSESDHYASSTNSYVEDASVAPAYRSAPINTQGFRYRDMKRNAPYVTFSDRVKQFMKTEQRFAQQLPPIQQPLPPLQPLLPLQQVQVRQLNVTARASVIRKQQNMGVVGNYKFRPDERFAPQPPAPQVAVKPMPDKVIELVGAKVQESGDNFLDDWSFRPESTF